MSVLNTYPHELNGEVNIVTDSIDINGSIYAVGIYNDIYLYLTKFNYNNTIDTTFGHNGFNKYCKISSKSLSIIFSQTYSTNFTNKNANVKMLYKNDKIYVFLTNNDTPVTFIIARFNIDGTLDNTYYDSGYYAHDNTDDLTFVDAISINESIVLLCQNKFTNGQIHLIYLNSNGIVTNTITVNSSDFNISSFNNDNSGDWNAVSMHFDSDENIYVGINIINSNTANSYGGIFKISRTFSIDESFGTNGIFTYSANSFNNTLIRDIIIYTSSSRSNKIYALFTDNTNKEFIICKLKVDGSSDTSFNSNGIKKITDSNFTPIIYTSTLDHNSTYIISGTYFNFATLEEKLFYYKIKSDGSTESDDLVNSLGFYEYENRTVLDNTKYTEIYSIILGTSTIYSNGKRYDFVPIKTENVIYSDTDFNPNTTNGYDILYDWVKTNGDPSDPYARHTFTLTDETNYPFANGTYQISASSDINPSYIHNLHIVLENEGTGTTSGLDWVTTNGSYVWNGVVSSANGDIVTTSTNCVDYVGSWVQISLPYSLKLYEYNISRSSHLPYLNPTYQHFLGSNDGGATFDFIQSKTGSYDGVNIKWNERAITSTKGYSTIRMVVEEIGGNGDRANSINIEHWDLKGQVVEFLADTENKQTVAFMQSSPYKPYSPPPVIGMMFNNMTYYKSGSLGAGHGTIVNNRSKTRRT